MNIKLQTKNLKPIIFGELGTSSLSWHIDSCVDVSFHNAIWATSFMGSFGCGLYWWWDNAVHANGYYTQFQQLSDFMAGVDFDNMGFTAQRYPDNTADIRDEVNNPIEAFYLKSADETNIIGWVHNRSYYWYNFPTEWQACRDAYDADSSTNINYQHPTYTDTAGIHINGNYPFPYQLNDATYHLTPIEAIDSIHYTTFDIPTADSGSFYINVAEQYWTYDVEFYNTRTGQLLRADEYTDIFTDQLTVNTPLLNDSIPDLAFKINVYTGNYRTGTVTAQNTHSRTNNNLLNNGINSSETTSEISIRPNPVNDILNIRTSEGSNYELTLMDITGKTIINTMVEGFENQIYLGGLQPGIYNLRLGSNQANMKVFKLIKL